MITTETWKSWEGHAIEGRIALRQWLGGTQHSAVFLTDKPGQSGKKAVIKLIQSENLTLDGEVARLRAIAKLAHPHLIQIFDAGGGHHAKREPGRGSGSGQIGTAGEYA